MSAPSSSNWVRTITSPFRKARNLCNSHTNKDKKSKHGVEEEERAIDLHGEVMNCGYEDVQVMWSILDKSRSTTCTFTP